MVWAFFANLSVLESIDGEGVMEEIVTAAASYPLSGQLLNTLVDLRLHRCPIGFLVAKKQCGLDQRLVRLRGSSQDEIHAGLDLIDLGRADVEEGHYDDRRVRSAKMKKSFAGQTLLVLEAPLPRLPSRR